MPFKALQNTYLPPCAPISILTSIPPVHPSHIPLAPMYPPDFDSPTSVIDTPTPYVPQPLRPRRKYLVMFIP
eukprot:scaffold211_cov175-Isochrysis_galbana.AAC.2